MSSLYFSITFIVDQQCLLGKLHSVLYGNKNLHEYIDNLHIIQKLNESHY